MTTRSLQIEPSVQSKNTFNKRCVIWVNLSRVRNPAAAPRCQASIARARRLPEARPRPSTLGGQGTGRIFIYTLHRHELVHRSFEPSVLGLWWSSVQLEARDATDAAIAKSGTPVVRVNELDERFASCLGRTLTPGLGARNRLRRRRASGRG